MPKNKSALIVGASRGLGLAIVKELAKRGWNVTGTVRGEKTELHALAERMPERVHVEHVDITDAHQISELKSRLKGSSFDLLFVNAGVANGRYETVGEVSTDDFVRVMVTNALAPLRVLEQLSDIIKPEGTLGVMSSGQGSVTNNEKGGFEVYRASKAALNMLMRSFAARRGQAHPLLLLAPGWIKTDMGGDEAPFSVEDVIGDIVNTIIGQAGKPGLQYLDRFGKTVPW